MNQSEDIQLAEKKKLLGTLHLNERSYENAISQYKQAIEIIKNITVSNSAFNPKLFIDACYQNMALCCMKQKQYEEAINYLSQLNKKNNLKALYRRGICYLNINKVAISYLIYAKLKLAQVDLYEALKLDYQNEEVKEALQILQRKLKQKKENKKQMSKRIMKGIKDYSKGRNFSDDSNQSFIQKFNNFFSEVFQEIKQIFKKCKRNKQ